jgi:UDP-glucose 4-epimerase
MKILVTGSRGFIGSHVCQDLREHGHEVTVTDDVDLTRRDQVMSLPDVDTVLHFAAINQPRLFVTRPFDVMTTNVLSTQWLLERYASKIQRFVLASTSEVYAGSRDYFDVDMPTPESVPLCVTDATDARASYGGSKIANELQIQFMQQQTDTDFTIIRYHNVYGPGQRNQFIPDFLHRVATTGDTTLMGGASTRTYLYIDDAVAATRIIATSPACVNKTVNVGGAVPYTIREVAEIILQIMGSDLQILETPGGAERHRHGNIGLVQQLTGWHPTITLPEGLAHVVAKYFDKQQ